MGAISEDLSLLDCSILLSSDIDMSTLEALKSMYFAQGVIPHRESWFLLAGAFCLGRSTLWSWDENAGRAPSVSPAIRDIVKHEDDNAKALETLSLKHATQHLSALSRSGQGLHELPTDQFNLNKEVEVDITLVPPVQVRALSDGFVFTGFSALEGSQEYRVFLLTLINMPDGPPKQGTSRFPRHCLLKERSWRSHLRHSEANVDPPVRVTRRRASRFLLHFEVSMNLSRHFGGRRMAASHPDRTEWSAKLVVVTPFGPSCSVTYVSDLGAWLFGRETKLLPRDGSNYSIFSPSKQGQCQPRTDPKSTKLEVYWRRFVYHLKASPRWRHSFKLSVMVSYSEFSALCFTYRRLTNQMDPKDSSKDVNTTRPLAIQVEKMNTESGENTTNGFCFRGSRNHS
ncbi:hypothetical protein BS47DRAFT_1402756 [Hydnum rufescens UP504]|uniref:Uncharacterized protein n=1 Tax=Hydnum rufescens UP504 TaxID=1448309 RepID=A0A9P6DLI5_9AGAM|nr:hypothetical protein BS47DRAFT_1402756 [Hydnum rufescens UP504]